MGYYINKVGELALPPKGKADFLINHAGATETTPEFKEDLVCVVDNGPFEAAAYAFSEDEFRVFNTHDGRRKKWLVVPNAKELAK